MLTQEERAVVVQRSHWYVNVIGCVPDQVPLLTVQVRPTRGVPVIAGKAVFTGGLGPAAV